MIYTDDPDVLVLRSKDQKGHVREMRFWAERGLIHCEDGRDNSYVSMSVREFLQKARAHTEMLGNKASRSDSGADANLREYVLRMLEKAERIAYKAKVQGMPSDASARRDLKNRRPKTIAVSGPKSIL